MLVADVKCYHCGHISGEISVDDSEPSQPEASGSDQFHPTTDVTLTFRGGRPRCNRCGGPTFLDDIRKVRPARVYDVMEKPRRGRPRRNPVLVAAS